MALARGFLSDKHEAAFSAGRAEHDRRSVVRRVCGARTRGGGNCQQPPLTGHVRCLRHAGPKAANALRERQIADLAAGRISAAEFEQREMRRAANRLREAWKRDPWTPGQTIDLAEHEHQFQVESGVARLGAPVAPAVLDWLRWRYRRLQIDRRRDTEWARVVREDYPRRVRDAGTKPPEFDPRAVGVGKSLWTAAPPPPGSRRARADQPHAPRPSPQAKTAKPSYLDDFDVGEADLARVAYEHRDVLGPLLRLCHGVSEQRLVLRALTHYLGRTGDLAALKNWLAVVATLRARGACQ